MTAKWIVRPALALLALALIAAPAAAQRLERLELAAPRFELPADPSDPVGSQDLMNRKSPGTALALSFLLTGAGQFYNEEYGKGLIMLAVGVAGTALALGGVDEYGCDQFEECAPWMLPVGLSLALGSKVWSMIDASASANRYNRRLGSK